MVEILISIFNFC